MKKLFFTVLIMILFILSSRLAYAGNIVIVVHKDNPIDDISFRDLVKIFKQDRQYWKDGRKIYLIMQEMGSPEKEIVLKKIYKMNNNELKKFWLTKMYREEISSFPKTLSSNEAVKLFVSQAPSAVGFMDSDSLDESIKILKIDGKLPEDDGYILTERIEGVRDED